MAHVGHPIYGCPTRKEAVDVTQYGVCVGSNCSDYGDFYDAMAERMVQMTFWAHKAVLLEKLKQKIEEQDGKKLDELVDLLLEVSKSEQKSDKELEQKHEELREKIKETFDE